MDKLACCGPGALSVVGSIETLTVAGVCPEDGFAFSHDEVVVMV